ncbi:MAG: FlgD ig protein, partial [Bacteroidota bacterium]|nr:FlgD ig protein [Bacteroidota bacterium]
MKKVILLAALMPLMASGQITENFESGNINNWIQSVPGHWQADTTASLNGRFSLHHVFDSQSGGTDCAGVPLSDLHPGEGATRWSFLIRHGYDPSASNNWALFLMSDCDPVSFEAGSPVNGYALGVNLTGYDDTLRLWKIKNGTPVKVVTCSLNWQTSIGNADAVRIVTERSESGIWTISVYDAGNNYISTAAGSDSELFSSSWLILNYRYTSTRDRLLWFDDLEVEGIFYEDKLPPEVIRCRIQGKNSAEILFNEEPSEEIVQISNFSLNSSLVPQRIEKINPLNIRLIFDEKFNNKITNILTVKQLCDRNGNCKSNIEIKFTPAWAEAGDVIISEIMADPFPAVALPGKEYLEILNRAQFPF